MPPTKAKLNKQNMAIKTNNGQRDKGGDTGELDHAMMPLGNVAASDQEAENDTGGRGGDLLPERRGIEPAAV